MVRRHRRNRPPCRRAGDHGAAVGAYVFGLLAGLGRETPETMRKHGASAETALPKLRVVPEAVWLAALGVFSALYLAFFFVQGRYLFGAFTRTLPESFTVAL